MSRYRRSHVAGATFFFTVALADRSSALLTEHIDLLRRSYGLVRRKRPFEPIAICVLPKHLHAIWELPPDDSDFSFRWNQIKSNFSRSFEAAATRSASKSARREKGIWQRRFWEHQIRDDRIWSDMSIHPPQSGQARPRDARGRLAEFKFSSLCRTRLARGGLGRKSFK